MNNKAEFCARFGTRFIVTVDTEEGFDWDQPLSRVDHTLTAIPALRDGQQFFEKAGVVPLYFTDYPVVQSDEALDILLPAVQAGTAEIGSHLHPWVTPPFSESVNSHNSYAGTLPQDQEAAKIKTITDAIIARFGTHPKAYRAGRYGIGGNTAQLLAQLGYRCDSSIRPLFDYRKDGGPDFRRARNTPYWMEEADSLIELPLSVSYVGWAGRAQKIKIAHFLEHNEALRPFAARARLLNRIPLTPEGIPAAMACRAIDNLVAEGAQILVMSFHSPSLAVGHTPYVQNDRDLTQFYAWFATVFDHCAKRGIAPASLAQILDSVSSGRR